MNLTTSQTQRALHFLASQQAPAGHRFSGAFVATLQSNPSQQQADWTVFNTASTLLLLRELNTHALFNFTIFSSNSVETMASNAGDFLQSTTGETPLGSYAFWPSGSDLLAQSDLDDTALALLALKNLSNQTIASGKDTFADLAWRLIAPYRLTSGMPLATCSRWAQAFPGIFLTWMVSDTQTQHPAVMDTVAIANVCRLLLEKGLLDFPGLSASLTMLATILTDSLLKETAIPIEQLSPYYRSREKLLASCAKLLPITPNALHVREAVKQCLTQQDRLIQDSSFNSVLWLASAKQSCALPLHSETLNQIIAAQQPDGGWPEISLCTDLLGRWRWTSRSLSTALALNLLTEQSSYFITSHDTTKELAFSC